MENVIHEYVRERKQRIGVIVGTVIGNMIVIGWSKTNLKAGDNFDKGIGIELALQRAKGVQETPSLPPQMNRQMREFKDRCMRYFQQATVLSTKGPVVKTEGSKGSKGSKVVKRGRGRPRKNKVVVISDQPKRPRGRPRKYPLPTLPTLPTESHIPKKRGRPKKYQTTPSKYSRRNEETIPPVPTIFGKLLGYCKHCYTGVSTLDHISRVDPEDKRANVYYCYNCCRDLKKSSLLKTKPTKQEVKYKSKREYLEDCLQVSEDMKVPMNPPDVITHKDLGTTPDVLHEP